LSTLALSIGRGALARSRIGSGDALDLIGRLGVNCSIATGNSRPTGHPMGKEAAKKRPLAFCGSLVQIGRNAGYGRGVQMIRRSPLVIVLGTVGLAVGTATSQENNLCPRAREPVPHSERACIEPARPLQCTSQSCRDYDAIVFVHGIYGSDDTFRNPKTKFDWPAQFPQSVKIYGVDRPVDVYRLKYRDSLLSWSKGKKS
jgi:hypothetical protein